MTIERMTGTGLHRVDAATLAPSEQLRALAQLAAVLDLEQLIEALPTILREIAPVDGVHYAGLTKVQQLRSGRRARPGLRLERQVQRLGLVEQPVFQQAFEHGPQARRRCRNPFRKLDLVP